MSEQQVLCQNCNAPLDYRQGDAVAFCAYCNFVNKFREEKGMGEHFMLGLQVKRENIRSYLLGDLLKVPGIPDSVQQTLKITEAKLKYIPYYVTQVHGNLQWAGLGRQATFHNKYKSGYRNISFYTEPESGVFDDQVSVTVFAGKDKIESLLNYTFAAKGRKYFDRGEISTTGGEIMDETFDFDKAEEYAVKALEAKHNNILADELEQVTETRPEYLIAQNHLIHVPIWFVKWKTSQGSREYNSIIDAASGVTIETDTPRSTSYILFTLAIGLVYAIIGIIPYLFLNSPPIDNAKKMLTIFVAIIGILLSGQTFYKNRPRKFKERKD